MPAFRLPARLAAPLRRFIVLHAVFARATRSATHNSAHIAYLSRRRSRRCCASRAARLLRNGSIGWWQTISKAAWRGGRRSARKKSGGDIWRHGYQRW